MDITELRNDINAIDEEICKLFVKRMHTALGIAEYKKENGIPVLDASRERAVLQKVSNLTGEQFEAYARTLYQTLMDVSKAYQNEVIGETTPLARKITELASSTPKVFPKRATVSCQGCEGAYSQAAAEKLFRAPEIVYHSDWEGVFRAVAEGMTEYGILPIENSTAGSVNRIYDLLAKHNVSIVRSVRVKVDHNLLALPGAKLEDIREIFSHEQALQQCSDLLASLQNVHATACLNTAAAAKMVAESGDLTKAALSSRLCARLYGLQPLIAGAQNNDSNYTRFICIAKEPEIYAGADRTSLMLELSNEPGSLFRILSLLNAIGANLTKLESRPIPGRDFDVMFYFDIEESVHSPEFSRMLCQLERACDKFRYLGTYAEII
ncbi:MAG: bifunctional chorismate mutase/prephenate dehydratase [Eubacteriales bacterium]